MIELCFDFVSPYSYLAWSTSGELAARTGHAVEPVPVLFAGILNALGTKGPAEVPARRAYLMKDVVRAAHRANVRIDVPQVHPFNPLLALRIAVLPMDGAERQRIIDALFTAAWVDGHRIDSPGAISDVLARADIDAAPLLARAAEPAAKNELRRQTDHAIARGAFGVPTMFVDGEMFFGVASFPEIEAYVRGGDPAVARRDVVDRWLTLPAAATR